MVYSILYDQTATVAIAEHQTAIMAGAEEPPPIQQALTDLDERLNEPLVLPEEEIEKMRLRVALGLPARPGRGV